MSLARSDVRQPHRYKLVVDRHFIMYIELVFIINFFIGLPLADIDELDRDSVCET